MNLLLRLTIWFLLTSDFSLPNIIIGIAIALLLPGPRITSASLGDWLRALREIFVAVPQAYVEAVEMILRPHRHEEIVAERVKPQRSLGLIFLDIFLITFTPKTIVVRYRQEGWYDVHYVRRRLH
ncbi:Na+/H+ antiporter subunit E [Oscillatoria sp. FACHB-1406]|uniref:Na+/H+ antiporter subunit E n=1 Tax=Oscillatoria sp. FACHB-1406 TaxID=2692846 RepID=UPI001684494E|nr:Na+/H+ antiporter subunit E [Oscillatoria sp. FACHB-1406]MBD2577921.1 Na+/H+ antiporter subunit E [Oscillatoria sp. FACHB-1406]